MQISIPERLSIVCVVLTLLAVAPDAQALDFRKYPALRAFAGDMSEKHGFSATKLKRVFRCATIRPDIIEAMERPKELLPWHEYRKLFVTEDNARRGVRFWKEHAGDIARAQKHYGVPPEIIIAIIGVETRYGRGKGNYPVLDALTTLTLEYPPRSEFFRKELEEFLLLAREIDVSPCEIKGSYAGAMGLPQFMPSSYRRLAVDFDGDGKRDLLDSPADTIGSIAHYLHNNGWEAGAPIIEEVKLEGTLYFWVEKLGIKPALSVRQLAEYGIFPRQRDNPERRSALISLEGEYGPFHRLGFNNFYVITRYNLSKRYAMAVVELGDMIRRYMEENSPT